MPTAESRARTLRFSVFEVDLRAAELRKHGVRVKLQDQPFRILSLLLEHPDEIVTREELRHQLWHDHTFVDFDRGLNKAIAKLRSALGDSAESPRYIETVPRHGYRLLVPVANGQSPGACPSFAPFLPELPDSQGKETALSPPRVERPVLAKPAQLFYSFTEGWSFSFLMTVVVVLVILVGLMSFRLRQPAALEGASSTVSPRRSIAVLGFRNLSGNPRDAWLSTALADWLGTELSAGGQLRTVPAESIARMKLELSLSDLDSFGPDKLARIRKNLGTDLLVVGSYAVVEQNSGGEIRLDLRLLDAKTGETTTAFSETGADSGLFELVSKAGGSLRARLGVRGVTSEETAEVAIALPSIAESARLYSEGREKLRVFDALAAQDLLQKAVAREPDFSLSHAALATAWSQLGYDENARTEAKKAFDLSSNLSRAERLLVEGCYRERSHEWDKAVEIYRALFKFFPDNVDYGIALASVQVSAGQGKDALATLTQLRQSPPPQRDDPRIDLEEDHVVESLGDFKGLLTSATAAAEKARAAGASLLQARALTDQGWALENLGAPDKVEPVVRDAEQLYLAAHDQRGVATAATLGGIALQMQGDYAGAGKQYERSLAIYRQIGYRFGVANEQDNFGDVHLALGNLPQARKSYEGSLKTYLEIGHVDGEALTKAGLGEVFLRQGDIAKSKKMLEESLEICRQIGDRSKEGAALSGLGRLSRMAGDTEAAWKEESEAKAIFDKIGDKSQSAQMQVHLADLLLDQGRSQEAADRARQAAEVFEKTKAAKEAAAAYLALARASLAQGNQAEAGNYLERTMKTARKSQAEELELSALITAARLQATSKKATDRDEAIRRLREVMARATTVTFAGIALDARLALAEIEMASGNRDEGRRELRALQKEAGRGGFGLFAKQAATALRS
jgi:eukaryotic-like serine/threonine-protein kinase